MQRAVQHFIVTNIRLHQTFKHRFKVQENLVETFVKVWYSIMLMNGPIENISHLKMVKTLRLGNNFRYPYNTNRDPVDDHFFRCLPNDLDGFVLKTRKQVETIFCKLPFLSKMFTKTVMSKQQSKRMKLYLANSVLALKNVLV